jgi:predicted ATP-dependent endonuclease of OLD family
MINPLWLSGAYIIENKAIDYDKEADLNDRQTNISANPYRTFVSQFPERVSYYQPVLERLGYVNPKVMPVKPVVITEGISDFHTFSAICKDELEKAKFEFVPGLGAGTSGPLISFLVASGKPFVVLLDDDRTGRKEAESYRAKWFLSEDTVFTIAALDAAFKNKKLETLLSQDTHKVICDYFSKSADTASKKEIGIYFAEKNYTTLEAHECSAETRKAVRTLVKKLYGKF